MSAEALRAHLATGLTTVCRCWAVLRRDGRIFGFTDHDGPLHFDGIDFRADSGMTGRALSQTTGLAVDNTEAMGVLSDAAITEADIEAGRFDAAEVRAWAVNWRDVSQRELRFRGTLGELRRGGGAFHAELRGLAEALNQPQGRVYQRACLAVLGDARCRFDLNAPGFSVEAEIMEVGDGRASCLTGTEAPPSGWFERGRLRVLSGAAEGLTAIVKHDRMRDGVRQIDYWEPVRARFAPGDRVRLEAGCDKRVETCRAKFGNFANFQGFPHIPGEDWMMVAPGRMGENGGGSTYR